MSRNADGERQLRQYLLGELGEEEQQRLEEQLLLDDERVELLLVVEEELIDGYLRDDLSARERTRFETYFLSTPARREKLLAAKALRRYIATTTGTEPETHETRQTSWWQRLFTPLDWKLAAVAAVLVLGLGLGIWRLFLSPSQVALGIAALKKAYPQQRPIEARISGFDYAPLTRTRGEMQKPLDPIAYGQAKATLFNAASEHPNAETRHGLSYLYLLEQQVDQAKDQLALALKADPSNARIHNDLGAVLMEMGKIEREKTEKREPKTEPGSDDSLKTFALANEHFTQALQIDSRLAEALFNQALCYQSLQLTEQALEAWRKYLELDSSSPWANEAKRHLNELEEQKKKTAWNRESFWEDFRSAFQSGDEERIREAFNRSRDRTRSFITERLLDEYLQFSAEGRNDEAKQRLAMLVQAGEIEERKGGDVFTRDLARYYQSTTSKQRSLLSDARKSLKAGRDRSSDDKEEALALLQQAGQKFAEAGNEWEAKLTDYVIGVIYVRLSDRQKCYDLAEQLARYAEDHHYQRLLAYTSFLLSDLYSGLNEHSKAIKHTTRALEIVKLLQSPGDEFAILGQLANKYEFLGDYEQSLKWRQHSLNLASRYPIYPSQQWTMYAAASVIFNYLNLFSTAIAYQTEALDLVSKMKPPPPLQMSRSHNFLGQCYGNLNNSGEAMKHFEIALGLSKAIADNRERQNMQAHSLLRLGNIHRKNGDLVQALDCYDKSARLYEALELAGSIFDAHRGKLLVYLAQRKDQAAQEELAITRQLLERDRAKVAEESLRNSFFDAGQEIYDLAIQLYSENLGDPEESFNYSERGRARSLLDFMQTGTSSNGERQTDELELPSAADPQPLSEIRKRIPSAVQIVQYAVLSEKLHIWVVSHSTFQKAVSAIRLDELISKVSDYLKSIVKAGESDAKEADRLARELYDILIKPVEPFLEANKEICFVPDEVLNYLPFEALIEPASGQYLIKKYTITLSPSSTIFLACTDAAINKNQPAQERCLSVGDPSFDRDRFPTLPRLPATGSEAERVAGYYSHSLPLRAGKARESEVRREIQNFEIIHLASHGLINEKLPGYSGIVLAKESSDAEPNADGFLEAREVSRMKLRRAKLVVLSACQTGLGRNYRGEGMVGLARAFLAADVPLVVASLWAVNDEATGELMKSFHWHRTQNKLSTAQALRAAQLEMLRHPQADYHKPSAWAAFVTVGGYATY